MSTQAALPFNTRYATLNNSTNSCLPCLNFGMQDIYKYVTHEKGLLGSQGEYNRRHRSLCQPAFRNKAQLDRFAEVVVQR
jgi:hypothetical protein